MTPEEMDEVTKRAEVRAEERFRHRAWTLVAVLGGLAVLGACGWVIYSAKRDAAATERQAREDHERGLREIERRGLERRDRGG